MAPRRPGDGTKMRSACDNCGTTAAEKYSGGLCMPCYSYQYRMKRPRPARLWHRQVQRPLTAPPTPESTDNQDGPDDAYELPQEATQSRSRSPQASTYRVSLRSSTRTSNVRYDEESLWENIYSAQAGVENPDSRAPSEPALVPAPQRQDRQWPAVLICQEEANRKLERLSRHLIQTTQNFRTQIMMLESENKKLRQRSQNQTEINDTEPTFNTEPLLRRMEAFQAENNALKDRLELLESKEVPRTAGYLPTWRGLILDSDAAAILPFGIVEPVQAPTKSKRKRERKLRSQVTYYRSRLDQLRSELSSGGFDVDLLVRENRELWSQKTQVEQFSIQQAKELAATQSEMRRLRSEYEALQANPSTNTSDGNVAQHEAQ